MSNTTVLDNAGPLQAKLLKGLVHRLCLTAQQCYLQVIPGQPR